MLPWCSVVEASEHRLSPKYSSAVLLKLPQISCRPKRPSTKIKKMNFVLIFQKKQSPCTEHYSPDIFSRKPFYKSRPFDRAPNIISWSNIAFTERLFDHDLEHGDSHEMSWQMWAFYAIKLLCLVTSFHIFRFFVSSADRRAFSCALSNGKFGNRSSSYRQVIHILLKTWTQ